MISLIVSKQQVYISEPFTSICPNDVSLLTDVTQAHDKKKRSL